MSHLIGIAPFRARSFATCMFLMATLLSINVNAADPARLTFVDVGNGGTACCLVPDGSGSYYVVGSVASQSETNFSITKLDSTNHVVSTFTFGAPGSDQATAAAADSQG